VEEPTCETHQVSSRGPASLGSCLSAGGESSCRTTATRGAERAVGARWRCGRVMRCRWTVCGRLDCSPAAQRRDRAGISIWQPGSGRGMPLQVLRPACPACNGANECIKSVGAAAARALTAPAPFHPFTFVLVLLVFARCLFVYSLPVPPNTALPRLAPTPPPTVHNPNPLPTLSPSSHICICSGAGTCTYPHPHTATTRPP
jgi:hypothetical protein